MAQAGLATHSRAMKECIDNCNACHAVDVETVQYCLERGGAYAQGEHVRLLLDCADMCRTTADIMARGSEVHKAVCAACAEVCERCAASCEQFPDDPQMRKSAETCRRCAESCRRMAA
jgi:hypothetical protein